MKVAVCFSGQPRFFEEGYRTLNEKLIKPNNADVFIHTWHDPQLAGQNYDAAPWNSGQSDICKNESMARIIELYKPVKFLIQKPRTFVAPRDYSSRQAKTPTHITFSMFYSILMANNLKKSYEMEEGFVYDWVVRSRFDLELLTDIRFEEYNNDMLYTCNHLSGIPDTRSDLIMFSNSAAMNKMSELFYHIDEYWVNDGVLMVNEGLLYHHLNKNNVPSQHGPIALNVIRGHST